MFSGIISEIGKIKSIKTKNKIVSLEIEASKTLKTLNAADSIALNGVCATVIKKAKNSFFVELMPETLKVTTFGSVKEGHKVNLEDSLKMGDKISGHFVLGHIDTVVRVLKIKKKGSSKRMYFLLPKKFQKYVKTKGSLALDGVGLTVSAKSKNQFSVDLIPYTLLKTTLGKLSKNDKVNLEVDVLARYVVG